MTREEFDAWKRAQTQSPELQRELETLRQVNRQLEQQLQQALASRAENPSEHSDRARVRALSQERIEEIVERLLQNADVNIRLLPDAVERHLYRNMFRLLLSVLAELIESSSVEFMGHEIQLSLVPSTRGPDHSRESAAASQESCSSEEACSEGRASRVTNHFRRRR